METNKEQFNPIGFQLKKISTVQFALIEENYVDAVQDVAFGFWMKFGINQNERMIASFVKIQFEQNQKPFLILEVGHHYHIEPTAWEKMKVDSNILLPQHLATHLLALTIGSARGVIHCKTENSIFNQFLIPTVKMNDIVQSDLLLK